MTDEGWRRAFCWIVFDSFLIRFWGGLFGGEFKNYNINNRLYY